MADADRCPNCGSELPHDAPKGLCPRCLLRQGLDSDAFSLAPGGTPAATMSLASGPDGSSVLAEPGRERRARPPPPAPRLRAGHRPRARRPARLPRDARARRPRRPAPAPRRDRPRRHGRRPQGPRRRPRPRPRRQGPAREAPRRPRPDPPLHRGGPDRRPVAASRRRAGLRAGRLRRPPPLLHDEAGQGPHPGRSPGRPARSGRRSAAVAGHLPPGLPDGGLRPRPRRDPPRPQAVERDGGQLRRGAGDGLGPGQGPAPGRRRRRRRRPAGRRPGDDHRHGPQRLGLRTCRTPAA